MESKTINFNDLIGEEATLYYNNQLNQFQLGSVLFEVIEDENDGLRSALENVQIVNETSPKDLELAKVIISKRNDDPIYELVDSSGFIWLSFGTDKTDEHYPMFHFVKNAKPPVAIENIKKLIK